MSRSYLSELENGKKQPSIKALEALADALNVALDALIPDGGREAEAEAEGRLGEHLRLARERKGMSLAAAAEAAGISAGYLSEIERGQAQPAVETLRLLAEVVGLPLSQAFHCGSIGDKVRMLRERLGLSRAELAEAAGVTPGFICPAGEQQDPGFFGDIETDSPVFDVSPCYLILEDDTAEEMIRGLES